MADYKLFSLETNPPYVNALCPMENELLQSPFDLPDAVLSEPEDNVGPDTIPGKKTPMVCTRIHSGSSHNYLINLTLLAFTLNDRPLLNLLKLCKGYFEAPHGYVIYSPRAVPSVNKPHIHKVPQNNWLIFKWARYQPRHDFACCFDTRTLTKQRNK